MKLRFRQTVQDKNDGTMYAYNSVHEFDDARAKEILAKGVAVRVCEPINMAKEEIAEESKPANPAEETVPSDLAEEAPQEPREIKLLEDMTLEELKEIAKQEGLAVRGTKAELVERIEKAHE